MRNPTSHSSTDSDTTNAFGRNNRGAPKPKHFYKFWLWPSKTFIKIRFDRLALLTALDRYGLYLCFRYYVFSNAM